MILLTDLVIQYWVINPLPSSRQYSEQWWLSEFRRENNQNCSVLCCVRQLYTHVWTVLKFACCFMFRFCIYLFV